MSIESPTILKSDKKEIQFEAVAELEEPIKRIIEKIKDKIENGEYGLIIGDDASGRIPALIFGNFIKEISKRKGLEKPNIIFIPGTLNIDDEDKQILADNFKSKVLNRRKILIVTDVIKTGGPLKNLVKLIKDSGFDCEIVTIGLEDYDDDDINRKNNLGDVNIVSGDYWDFENQKATPKIFRKRNLSGVYKIQGERKSRLTKEDEYDPTAKKYVQDSINIAREDAKVVIKHLIDWYESQKQNAK